MMKGNSERLERIIEAAFGDAVQTDVPESDQGKFLQFRQIAKALQRGFHEPTQAAVRCAKEIFIPPARKRLPILSVLGSVGARLVSGDETQVVIESQGVKVRLMYSRTMKGWDILGSVNDGQWQILCGDVVTETDVDGRFMLQVSGEACGLLLISSDEVIEIPDFEELKEIGRSQDR